MVLQGDRTDKWYFCVFFFKIVSINRPMFPNSLCNCVFKFFSSALITKKRKVIMYFVDTFVFLVVKLNPI